MRIRSLVQFLFPTFMLPTAFSPGAFIVHVQTVLAGAGSGDGAWCQYVARIRGVPYRSGYPLHILPSRLFGSLPLREPSEGSTADGVNLMSGRSTEPASVAVCFILIRLVAGWILRLKRSRFSIQFFAFSLSDQADRLRVYLELLKTQFLHWGYILGWTGV